MLAKFDTPVVLIIFNRPQYAPQMLERLRQVKPSRIFIVADGPRSSRPAEEALCNSAREAMLKGIDWEAAVETDFSTVNLGSKRRVVSGLNWVFERVDRVIILEDDCLPSVEFFRFADELLERFADDERIGSISGNHFLPESFGIKESYYFSRFPSIWGWATWRRVWRHYDVEMKQWPAFKASGAMRRLFPHPDEARYWQHRFSSVLSYGLDAWDYQFNFLCWQNGWLSVLPASNLVTNIGTGADATHTKEAAPGLLHVPVGKMSFPLVHPSEIVRRPDVDDWIQANVYGRVPYRNLFQRLVGKVNRTLKQWRRS